MIVFRCDRPAAASAGSPASRFTIVGAAKNDIPGQRCSSAAISSPSPDRGRTLTAPRAMCGSPYSPAPCDSGATWRMLSCGVTASMSA
jgi:hypothetical protein